jgi:hypothetical protein
VRGRRSFFPHMENQNVSSVKLSPQKLTTEECAFMKTGCGHWTDFAKAHMGPCAVTWVTEFGARLC